MCGQGIEYGRFDMVPLLPHIQIFDNMNLQHKIGTAYGCWPSLCQNVHYNNTHDSRRRRVENNCRCNLPTLINCGSVQARVK